MMTIEQLLYYCGTHADIWDDAPPTAVGLSAAQVTAFKNAYSQAAADHEAHRNLMEDAKSAGIKARSSIAALRTQLSSMQGIIKGFANTQADPAAVFALAHVDPPSPPTPTPAPEQPTDFRCELLAGGAIKLTWKAPNPSRAGGTLWFVRRKVTGESGFTQIGVVGRRAFTDTTIPSSSGGATYVVQGQRGNTAGQASLPFVIEFGVDGGGIVAITSQKAAA